MLLELIYRCIYILKALCKWLLSCLCSCKDFFTACYRTEAGQQTLTTLENSCITATRRLYSATGAAVGTAEGLTYAARHAAWASSLNVPHSASIMQDFVMSDLIKFSSVLCRALWACMSAPPTSREVFGSPIRFSYYNFQPAHPQPPLKAPPYDVVHIHPFWALSICKPVAAAEQCSTACSE